jgi:hypothetical protein
MNFYLAAGAAAAVLLLAVVAVWYFARRRAPACPGPLPQIPPGSSCAVVDGYYVYSDLNRGGLDIPGKMAAKPSIAACAGYCASTPGCTGFAYSEGTDRLCYPKNYTIPEFTGGLVGEKGMKAAIHV